MALGTVVPWRDPGFFAAQFTVEGYRKANGEEDPRAQFRTVSPGFFSALGVKLIAGRDFNDGDRADGEQVVIISESLAQRMFPSMDAVNRRMMWTDPVTKFIGVSTDPRRIVGVVADIDDENLVPEPTMTVYHPIEQEMSGGRLFIHAKMDPYALVPPVTKVIRELATDQPVERAATLDDIRAEVLAPTRVNALVFGGFAGVALLIAIVGVAGVLAFSVSARTREFGVRLAIGSTPTHLLMRVLQRRRRDRHRRHRRGRDRRAAAGADRRQLRARRADARDRSDRRRGVRPRRRRDPRVADAGGARLAGGRGLRAESRVGAGQLQGELPSFLHKTTGRATPPGTIEFADEQVVIPSSVASCLIISGLCRSHPVPASASTKSPPRSARAGWGRSFAPATRSSIATWR